MEEKAIPLYLFNADYNWPSMQSMIKHYKNADNNGLAPAFSCIKDEIYVKPKTFFELIEQHRKIPGHIVNGLNRKLGR